MLVYHYDEETKKFLYQEEAAIDPLETELRGEDIYLLPAYATFDKPLEAKEGYDVVFDNGWKYEPIPEPEPEPEPTKEELKKSRIAELETYLASTDWYAIRESETGIDIPADIKQARADARTEISTLRGDK